MELVCGCGHIQSEHTREAYDIRYVCFVVNCPCRDFKAVGLGSGTPSQSEQPTTSYVDVYRSKQYPLLTCRVLRRSIGLSGSEVRVEMISDTDGNNPPHVPADHCVVSYSFTEFDDLFESVPTEKAPQALTDFSVAMAGGAPSQSEQPAPQPNDSTPVVDQLQAFMERRKQFGIEKYGTPLQANNGRDALVDAFEEAADLFIYLGQAIIERDGQLP